jgi:predicted DCC family thiol-disulfide oxidoreductase YuxK
MSATSQPLVLFDGVCGLCNRFVDRLVCWDRTHVLRFAPLQGTTATAMDLDTAPSSLGTVLFVDDGRIYERSDAALRILMRLGGGWRLVGAFLIIPRVLRNGAIFSPDHTTGRIHCRSVHSSLNSLLPSPTNDPTRRNP